MSRWFNVDVKTVQGMSLFYFVAILPHLQLRDFSESTLKIHTTIKLSGGNPHKTVFILILHSLS